jgi:hypothetical protein
MHMTGYCVKEGPHEEKKIGEDLLSPSPVSFVKRNDRSAAAAGSAPHSNGVRRTKSQNAAVAFPPPAAFCAVHTGVAAGTHAQSVAE